MNGVLNIEINVDNADDKTVEEIKEKLEASLSMQLMKLQMEYAVVNFIVNVK